MMRSARSPRLCAPARSNVKICILICPVSSSPDLRMKHRLSCAGWPTNSREIFQSGSHTLRAGSGKLVLIEYYLVAVGQTTPAAYEVLLQQQLKLSQKDLHRLLQ